MKRIGLYLFLILVSIISPSFLNAKDPPKIVVWDLAPRNIKAEYALELTSILVSELAKWKKYEVYSQENVRTLAGWTAERMKLGCTETQCLLALGQMDVAKLVSGSVGKIGDTYSISLNLFDTENAKADHAVSEFCSSENELISLIQKAARKLFESAFTEKALAKREEEQRGFINSIGMEFIRISAGKFIMGSSPNEQGIYLNESFLHEVEITRPFYMGKYEVTQGQWQKVMGNNPSSAKGDDLPVNNISWQDIQEFIKKINERENINSYRLPTEAEWEYVCRTGGITSSGFGIEIGKIGEYAWFRDNSGKNPNPVGQKKQNNWGLHDLLGNVSEWVEDVYVSDGYKAHQSKDPVNKSVGLFHVVRGGNWGSTLTDLRCAYRDVCASSGRLRSLGFRLLREDD